MTPSSRLLAAGVCLLCVACPPGGGVKDAGAGGGGGFAGTGGGGGGAVVGGGAAGGSSTSGDTGGGAAVGGGGTPTGGGTATGGGSAAGGGFMMGGGSASGGGAGGGSTLTLAQYCPAFATARCQRAITCGMLDSADRALCELNLANNCLTVAREADAGIATFNGTAAARCVNDVPGWTCNGGIVSQGSLPPSCDLSLIYGPGSPLGGRCNRDLNCSQGYCRGGGATACVACIAYAPLDGDCNTIACDPASTQCLTITDGGQRCRPYGNVGENCLSTTFCGAGKYCQGLRRELGTFLDAGTCQPRIALGTACINRQFDDGCADGGTCLGGNCVPAPVFAVAANGECENDGHCASGFCRDSRVQEPDGGPGVRSGSCITRSTRGQPCSSTQPCDFSTSCGVDGGCTAKSTSGQSCGGATGLSCTQILVCANGTCERPRLIGASCTGGIQCMTDAGAPALCGADGGCQNFIAQGAPCTANAQCETSRCINDAGTATGNMRFCGGNCY